MQKQENDDWLVVSNICYFPFHIWDVILPIDEYFSRWLLHHQPDDFGLSENGIYTETAMLWGQHCRK